MGLSHLLPLLAACLGLAYSEYVALAPHIFRPGWTYSVQLSVTSDAAVTVTGRITPSGDTANTIVSGTTTVTKAQPSMLNLQVPLSVDARMTKYTLQLQGSGGLTFSNSTNITLNTDSHIGLVQTDKPIYKPGQRVLFRALIVDKDVIPVKSAKTIIIENPEGSRMMQSFANATNTVFEDEYQIFDAPVLGNWTIKIQNNDLKVMKEVKFKVDEYVVPKFEVTVEMIPGFLVRNDKSVTTNTARVTAKYTSGKGVTGDVVIRYGTEQVKMNRITDPSGVKDVELELAGELGSNSWASIINVKAEVSDGDYTINGTATVKISEGPVMLEVVQRGTDSVFKNGMPLTALVKVTDPVGKPLSGAVLQTPLMLKLQEGYRGKVIESKTVTLTPQQTMVQWTIPTINSDAYSLLINASMTIDGKSQDMHANVQKFETIGNASLSARWVTDSTGKLKIGSNVQFAVDLSSPNHFSSVMYMIVSRGGIQAQGAVTIGQATTLPVTTAMCPNGRLVVYGITSDANKEIIAASLQLVLEQCQNKKVTPSGPSSSLETGKTANMGVAVQWTDSGKTDAIGEHIVYMVAVDKGILLLGGTDGDNDFNPQKIEMALGEFDLGSVNQHSRGGFPGILERKKRSFIWPPYRPSPKSTGDLFKSDGILVVTDLLVKTEPFYGGCFDCDRVELFNAVPEAGIQFKGDNEMVDDLAQSGAGGGGALAPAVVTVRKDFPDTWIWKATKTDSSGVAQLIEKVPDSITSWVISGFAVQENSELAVTADPFQLAVVNPFFVSQVLPYSIRRGEVFVLRATVFNYETANVEAIVTLAASQDYVVDGSSTKTVNVKVNQTGSVEFKIDVKKVGTIYVNVSATAITPRGRVTDVSQRTLIVRPEGMKQMRAQTFPVQLSGSEASYEKNVKLDLSPWTKDTIVPQSRRALVKITGDLMGNPLADIASLIQMPYGCGEQNMISTVPNINVLAYLTAINDLDPQTETNAVRFINIGYSKELTYKHKDGGFSAFGNSDPQWSTWLTAFVLRSFAHAREYVSTIPASELQEWVADLNTRQMKDGSFQELGRVIHSEMQGDTDDGKGLSVYVAICLLEAKRHGLDISVSADVVDYVYTVADSSDAKTKPYLAVITAYALALVKQNGLAKPNTDTLITALLDVVTKGNNTAPWLNPEDDDKKADAVSPWMRKNKDKPSDIEITAYFALTFIHTDRAGEASDMIKWLQRKQNSNGGYLSTQDTVMALQALSEFAAKFAALSANTNRKVTVTATSPQDSPHEVTITPANSRVLTIVELPDDTDVVNIKVTGDNNSLAIVKVVWHFNTPAGKKPPGTEEGIKPGLNVTTTTVVLRPKVQKLEACIKKERGLTEKGMVLASISLPSGQGVENFVQTKKDNPDCVRFEMQAPDLYHCYFNEPMDSCINVILEEQVKVENLKDGIVEVMPYYDPGQKREAPVVLKLNAPCEKDCGPTGVGNSISLSHLLLVALIGMLSLIVALD